MTTGQLFIIIGGLFWFLYTLSFAIYFHKTADKVFTPTQKQINSVLIWLVPFIWIVILKAIIKPTRQALRNKKLDSSGATSDDYNQANSWIFFLHDSSSSSSGHDSGGHYGGEHNHGVDSTDSSH